MRERLSSDARRAALLGLAALVVRVAFVLIVERKPEFPSGGVVSETAAAGLRANGLFNDAFFYHRTAEFLAGGDGFVSNPDTPTAQWPPLFTLMLGLVYRVFGADPLAGELLNAVLGALTVPVLYFLALRVFGRKEAAVAGALLAVFPGQILWTDVLLSETLYALVLVGFFLLLARLPVTAWSALVAGVAIGLAVLTRGEAVLLVPALAAAWWPELPRRVLAGRVALVALAAVLAVAPWTVRNALAMDAFVPLSSNSSITLWSGHNPAAKGDQNYAPASLLSRIRARGKEREIEESRLLRSEALEFMAANPRRELELIPLKLLSLNRGDSRALDWVNSGDPARRPFGRKLDTPVRVVADFGYYALLGATVLSVLVMGGMLWSRRAVRGILVLFAGALVLYGFVYYGNYRYRVPLEPLMILVAAPLLTRLWRLRGERL